MENQINLPGIMEFLGDQDIIPRPICLQVENETLHAYSKSAHYTFFIFKKKRICFDLGFCPMEAVPCEHVFLSHAHEDHSWGLIRHIQYRHLFKLPPANYYLPYDLVDPFKGVLETWNEFNQRRNRPIPPLIGLKPNQTLSIQKNVIIKSFETHHSGPSLGYHWFYDNSAETERPFFTFLGDHSVESLRSTPICGHSRHLAIELTFLKNEHEKARQYKHMHLDDFISLASEKYFQNESVIIKHFSSRYSRKEIETLLGDALKGYQHPRLILI